jgi:hypothetical protein
VACFAQVVPASPSKSKPQRQKSQHLTAWNPGDLSVGQRAGLSAAMTFQAKEESFLDFAGEEGSVFFSESLNKREPDTSFFLL